MSSARIIDSSSLPKLTGKAFDEARDHTSDSETASVTTNRSSKRKKRRSKRRTTESRSQYAASETDEDETGTVRVLDGVTLV